MKLGWKELRRQPGRFASATAILFLLGALLLLLSGLVEGLQANTDSLLRSQSADLIVFSKTAEKSIPQSLIPADVASTIAAVDGVSSTGALGLVQLGGRLPGSGPRDLIDVVVVGYDQPFAGLPTSLEPGTTWVDSTLRARDVGIDTIIEVGAARTPLRVAGFVDDVGFQTQPTMFVPTAALAEIVAANKPDAVLPDGATQALVVDASSPATVARAIDRATGSTVTVTRDAAADAVPDTGGGVLQQIIGLTVLIATAVVALFFALLTGERVGLYGVLKAIGARNRSIFAAVMTQAVVLSLIAGIAAAAVAVAFEAALPTDSIPFVLTPARLVTSLALLLLASVIGASFSLRRVLRIDPASAIGTST